MKYLLIALLVLFGMTSAYAARHEDEAKRQKACTKYGALAAKVRTAELPKGSDEEKKMRAEIDALKPSGQKLYADIMQESTAHDAYMSLWTWCMDYYPNIYK
jgi:hypothetical protein